MHCGDPAAGLCGAVALTTRVFLPPGPFLRRILGRSVVIWLGVRAALLILALQAGDLASVLMGDDAPVGLTIPGTAVLVIVVGVVGMLDLVRRHERLFFANLGVRDGMMAVTTVVLPALLEGALQVIG